MTEVNACKLCGVSEREHSIEWSEDSGYHQYSRPDDALRLERMKDNND